MVFTGGKRAVCWRDEGCVLEGRALFVGNNSLLKEIMCVGEKIPIALEKSHW